MRMLNHYLPFDEAKELILRQMDGMGVVPRSGRVLPHQHPMDIKCQMAAGVCAGLTGGTFTCGTALHRWNFLSKRRDRGFHCWVIAPDGSRWDVLDDFWFGHIEDTSLFSANILPGSEQQLLMLTRSPGLAADYIPWWREVRGV